MTKPWDGRERRKPQPDGREGRRPSDQHCGQHETLWAHHEKDKDQYRELTCGKIREMKINLVTEVDKLEKADSAILTKIDDIRNSIVGKYWFRVVIGFMMAGIVALGVQQNWAFKEILENQREFTVLVNSIENNQIDLVRKVTVFEKEIDALNKRQDVLRDAHLKIVQDKNEQPKGGTK